MAQADVIVTVVGIPLVEISVRAAIAGMTTMIDYGMFGDWDATHRHQRGDDSLSSPTSDR